MKKFKAILALVLVACLFVTLFAACAQSEEQTNTNTNTNTNTDKAPEQDADEGDEPVDPEEVLEVVLWIPDLNNAGGADHCDRLEKNVNTITEPEGIHVEMVFLSLGEYRQKATMDIAAGEKIDLMCYWAGMNVLSMYNGKMAMPLDDLLAEYAPSTLELMGDFLPATTFNGEIYSVPVLRNYVTNGYICFNKDMLDQWGLADQAASIKSWSDLEAVLGAIHENVDGTGVYPFVPWGGSTITYPDRVIHGDSFADIEVVDALGDGTGVVYNKDGVVTLWQADEAYKASCIKAKEWMDKGWCWPDSMFDANVSATEIMGQGAGVAEYTVAEEGVDIVKNGTYGAQSLCVKICDGDIKTSTMTGWGMGIPISAQEPEAAMELLEMIYTDETLMKALVNGIEGEDYEIVDGQAKPNAGMYNMGNYVIGNNLLTLPQYGNGADFHQRVEASNNNAKRSAFMGFVLVTDDLQNQIANISAVTDQYRCTMQVGGYSDDYLAEYLGKLEAAGVQEYLDAVQAQLDAWLASK